MAQRRGKAWTQAEDDIIRILHREGLSVREIAARIAGRGKSSVHKRLKAMGANGTLNQGILDMGQADAHS